MKLSKEQFVKYVNEYKRMQKEESEIIDALDVCPEWRPSGWLNSFYDFLDEMCELEPDPVIGTTLDWWVLETNFGKTNATIWVDGKEIELFDARALYDYLVDYEVKTRK